MSHGNKSVASQHRNHYTTWPRGGSERVNWLHLYFLRRPGGAEAAAGGGGRGGCVSEGGC